MEITPFLWFDDQAEDALDFYSKVFANSRVVNVSKGGDPSVAGGFIIGSIKIENLLITVFNGGPAYTFNEAISLFVSCETQEEVDHLWSALGDGGTPGRCGWLKDRFGVSWQVIPTLLGTLMSDPDPAKASRVRDAMMQMSKIDGERLLVAYNG